MRAGLTWLTMGNLLASLPVTPAYAMVARSKSPLDFNTKAGPPIPSVLSPLDFNAKAGPPIPSVSETAGLINLADHLRGAGDERGINDRLLSLSIYYDLPKLTNGSPDTFAKQLLRFSAAIET